VKPLTEADQAQRTIDTLTRQVQTLERKLAHAHRASEQRALTEREKWMTALSPEVGPIQERILGRMR
jgi:hypothetical protein